MKKSLMPMMKESNEKLYYQDYCKKIGLAMTLNSYKIISNIEPIEKRKKIFNIACQLAKLESSSSLKSFHINAIAFNLELKENKEQAIQTELLTLNINQYDSLITCNDAKLNIKSFHDKQCETTTSLDDLETRILILEEKLKHIYLPI